MRRDREKNKGYFYNKKLIPQTHACDPEDSLQPTLRSCCTQRTLPTPMLSQIPSLPAAVFFLFYNGISKESEESEGKETKHTLSIASRSSGVT